MINSRKTIGIFGCQFTSRYRMNLPRFFNDAAQELGVNLVFVNFLGKIGDINAEYGEYELELLNYIDLDQFDGIIFDGEGYNVQGMAEAVIEKLRMAKCPVVSISSHVEGFHNIIFEDAFGIRLVIEHFLDVHKFTKLGFMSGYLTHPDAQLRLEIFRSVMRERGLPEDGSGIFEGDFWYYKGEEAADYFLALPERPEAIVCANDYMAISLITALKKRNVAVPQEIAVSGYDGTTEGRAFLPQITTITRERSEIAHKSLQLILDILEGRVPEDPHIAPHLECTHSCGCRPMDLHAEAENMNRIHSMHTELMNNIYDSESSILKLNKVDRAEMLEDVFRESAVNVGAYNAFMLMLHKDRYNRLSCNSDFERPTGHFAPLIWIDKSKEYQKKEQDFDGKELIPHTQNDAPHFYYIMSAHCAERMFGYALIEMKGHNIFNEFFNMWLLNISVTLETLLKNDRITKLIDSLEKLSIRDDLTGMLNRRGFDELARAAISSLRETRTVCTIVIDMDGLKHINDAYGHHEGDRAIKAAANIIMKCCDNGEIAGRTGGDEFYIFAPDYSESKLDRFTDRIRSMVLEHNAHSDKPYCVDLSFGSFLTETDRHGRLDSFLHISDVRMYDMKMSKPNRRK